MSLYDYQLGLKISAKGYPFYALIQAAIRQADSDNLLKLQRAFPAVHLELLARRDAPGGKLPNDDIDGVRARINSTPAPKRIV